MTTGTGLYHDAVMPIPVNCSSTIPVLISDFNGLFLSTACCVDMKVVSLPTTLSVGMQGVNSPQYRIQMSDYTTSNQSSTRMKNVVLIKEHHTGKKAQSGTGMLR
jgi:hypothetical protein